MTGTNCDLFTHKSSRSYLNHLVLHSHYHYYFLVFVFCIPLELFFSRNLDRIFGCVFVLGILFPQQFSSRPVFFLNLYRVNAFEFLFQSTKKICFNTFIF
jgi:hypothetical protein